MNNEQSKILYSHDAKNWERASEDFGEAVELLIEEAIVFDDYIEEGCHEIYKGECVKLKFTDLIDIGSILEHADIVEYQHVKDLEKTTFYKINVTTKQMEDLEKLIQQWADKYSLNPRSCLVKNVRAVNVFVKAEAAKSAGD